MSTPWTIIGWIILALVIGIPLLKLCGYLVSLLLLELAYRKTRNIQPREGQVWLQDGTKLYILHRQKWGWTISDAPEGYRGTHATWGDTFEEWNNRVRNRKLICIQP